ncbi:transposon Tf2-6 polyprotein [Elysia marginata]|uniref:Transposon Tf2-6 polyprotein n=1 Tax=Elysia marginata TaxID=1093978 RepID=A0AAV4HLS9_9GAST|nr:transposon Tf2-6 polyprotein [Elysia marginata]
MPALTNVSELRAFLRQIQYFGKFLPNFLTVLEPLYHLTKKEIPCCWSDREQKSFENFEGLLCTDTVLAHYDPSLDVGMSCQASECGIETVLFYRYRDDSERHIGKVSKTLLPTQ